VTQFAAATGRKYAGRQVQKGGTLGVDQSAQKALAIVKELNAIITKKLRTTDPVLLGVWKAASRLEQPPKRAKDASSSSASAAANESDAAILPAEEISIDENSQYRFDDRSVVSAAVDSEPKLLQELPNQIPNAVAIQSGARKEAEHEVTIRRGDNCADCDKQYSPVRFSLSDNVAICFASRFG
jgi:hypothetical protein